MLIFQGFCHGLPKGEKVGGKTMLYSQSLRGSNLKPLGYLSSVSISKFYVAFSGSDLPGGQWKSKLCTERTHLGSMPLFKGVHSFLFCFKNKTQKQPILLLGKENHDSFRQFQPHVCEDFSYIFLKIGPIFLLLWIRNGRLNWKELLMGCRETKMLSFWGMRVGFMATGKD